MKILLCSKLSRTWFLILFIGITTYLLIKAIRKYLEFKTHQFDVVFNRELDKGIITMYLTSIVVAISSAICCITCVVFQTGNYANDSVKYGSKILDFKLLRLEIRRQQMIKQMTPKTDRLFSNFCLRIKHNLPAFFSCFYFISSFSFYFTLPYLDSERIRLEFDLPGTVWCTNLDIFISSSLTEQSKIKSVSPEFFNLCISLIVHAFSYANVFWRFNKTFSFIFTMVILFSGFVFIFDLVWLEVLIKLSRNPEYIPKSLKIEFQWLPLVNILSFTSLIFMVILQLSIYEYGYSRLKDNILSQEQSKTEEKFSSFSNNNNNVDNSNISLKIKNVQNQVCSESYNNIMLPLVIGIVSTILSIVVKLPYIYKSMKIIYPQTKSNLILANVILSIIYLVLVIIIWIGLVLKSKWQIRNYNEFITVLNDDCPMYVSKYDDEIINVPSYASVIRHSSLPPHIDQEPEFPIFFNKMSSQCRYSCSPPSFAPNDSNSTSDATVSGKNLDIGNGKKNYVYLSRLNVGMDSPNFNQGIYSQLIKLTPQLNVQNNPLQDNSTVQLAISNETSDNSSNRTTHHIMGPSYIDIKRRTTDKTCLKNLSSLNSDNAATEYFNIIPSPPQPLLTRQQTYDPTIPNNTDADINNLCTQV